MEMSQIDIKNIKLPSKLKALEVLEKVRYISEKTCSTRNNKPSTPKIAYIGTTEEIGKHEVVYEK